MVFDCYHFCRFSQSQFNFWICHSKFQARESGRNVKFVYKTASKAVKTKIKNARSSNTQGNVMTTSGIEIGMSLDRSSPDLLRRRHSQDSNNNSSGTSSPSHSFSSSDMNILQELEQEGLFDKPEINRSVSKKFYLFSIFFWFAFIYDFPKFLFLIIFFFVL